MEKAIVFVLPLPKAKARATRAGREEGEGRAVQGRKRRVAVFSVWVEGGVGVG